MPSYDDWAAQGSTMSNAWTGRIRTWNNTPNFGTVPKDQRPINGYSDQRLKASASSTTEVFFGWNYVTGQWDILTTTPYVWTLDRVYSFYNWHKTSVDTEWNSDKSGIENNVKLKALVKVADAKVNLAVAYAEASKTSSLILDTARRIDRAYRAFRRGNLREVANQLNITPKKVHKTWLEYKYGWMPLLMDVKGAAEFFAQQHIVRKPRFKVTAMEKVVKTYDRSEDLIPWGGPPHVKYTELWSRYIEAKAVIWCELSSPHLSELQQLGVTNPALVAWELVPFSFVFDWFIQVGDWLTGMTALQGVTVIRAFYSTVESDGFASYVPPSDRHDASYRYRSSGQAYELSKRHYQRVPWLVQPSELYPPVTNSFNFTKLVTSLALVRNGYRGNARL